MDMEYQAEAKTQPKIWSIESTPHPGLHQRGSRQLAVSRHPALVRDLLRRAHGVRDVGAVVRAREAKNRVMLTSIQPTM